MEKIARYLFITSVIEDEAGVTIIAHDLAVRNFGGKFGRTVLRFDNGDKLRREHVNL